MTDTDAARYLELDIAVRKWLFLRPGVKGCLLPLEGKKPCGVKWSEPVPTETLLERFRANPRLNLGLVTGTRSGVVAIDLDNVSADVLDAARRGQDLPFGPTDTARYITGRAAGGLQLLYQHSKPLESRRKLELPGVGVVELKADGCQVAIPPSIHPDTGHRREYEPGCGLERLRDFSELIIPALSEAEPARESEPEPGPEPARDLGPAASLSLRSLAEPVTISKRERRGQLCLSYILGHDCPEGSRNGTAVILYGRLVRCAEKSRDSARNLVRAWNARLTSPQSDAELEKAFFRAYNHSCDLVRASIPGVGGLCQECRNNRRQASEREKMLRTNEHDELQRRADITKTELVIYEKVRTGQVDTRRELARVLNLSERAIYKAINRLEAKTGIKV